MKRELSIYLDLFRCLAAFAVVGEHTSDYVGGWAWRFGSYGAEAVCVFFVLSGFVIAFVSNAREQSAASYATARAARMYSVVIPVMIITWLIGVIGPLFDPETFNLRVNYKNDWLDYLRCVTFMHQIWNTDTHFGTNGPFWSMGFEVPYYILFGVVLFVKNGFCRNLSIFALLAFFGPRIGIYFPLWLLGVWCYHLTLKRPAEKLQGRAQQLFWLIIWGGALLSIAFLHSWAHEVNTYLKIYRRFQFTADYFETVAYFYTLGLLFASSIIAFTRLPTELTELIRQIESPVRWVAGATFTLYLANLPLLLFVKSLLPTSLSTNVMSSVALAIILLTCFLLAEFIERRKGILGRAILARAT